LTCLIFLVLGKTDRLAMLTALSVAAVVCIASSNGGTTSQDLKTGFLVGATPRKQQLAIVIGAVTSALVIGLTMLALNSAGVHYTKKGLPDRPLEVPADAPRERPGRPYDESDTQEYRVVHVVRDQYPDVEPGRYLVDEQGRAQYKTDIPINQQSDKMDNGADAPKPFSAPQPQLFSLIIEGILSRQLEWGLVIVGVLVAIALELASVSALPFAVGMYLPLATTAPIFVGGLIRWLADRIRGVSASESETETSPGVLLASGYIAGGTLIGLILAFFAFLPDKFNKALAFGTKLGEGWPDEATGAKLVALAAFIVIGLILLRVGTQREPVTTEENGGGP
jgi:uncharacterized oligopeptide transporter (OPT) family protein